MAKGKPPLDEFWDAVTNPAGQKTIATKNPFPRGRPPRQPRAPRMVAKPVKPPKPARIAAPKPPRKTAAKPPPLLPARARGEKPVPKGYIRTASGVPVKKGGSLVGELKGIGNAIVAGNPITSLERALIEHPFHPGAALHQQASDVLGPDIPNALTGHPFSTVGLGLGAAALFPGGKAIRGLEAVGEAGQVARAGEGVAAAARAGGNVARRGKLPADRIIRLTDRTGTYEARVPSAPEAHIRAAQKATDRNLERVVREGHARGLTMHEAVAQKTTAARLAAAHLKRLTERTGFYEAKGLEAGPKALANVKLTDAQHMALRQMARNVHPNITIKANLKRIADAAAAGDKTAVRDLKRENTLLQASRHYIEGTGTNISLRAGTDKATRRLTQAWADMRREGAASEATQIKLGELTPEIAAARKNKPGELDLAHAGYLAHPTTVVGWHGGPLRGNEIYLAHDFKHARMYAEDFKDPIRSNGQLAKYEANISNPLIVTDANYSDMVRTAEAWAKKQNITVKGEGSSGYLSAWARAHGYDAIARPDTGILQSPGMTTAAEIAILDPAAVRPSIGEPNIHGFNQQGGYAGHQGNLYYPSAREVKKFSPRGAWKTSGQVLPFKPRGETKQPWTGALQDIGAESPKAANLIGKQAVARQSRSLAIDRLEQLRGVAMQGTLPQVGELDKAYRAIRLVPTANSEITQRFNALTASLDRKITITPQEAEQVGVALRQLLDELMPPVSQVLKEGKLPKEFGLVHRAFLGALEDPKLFRTTEIGELHRAMMTLSTLSKDMIVYTKIGHMPPRLASNILMALPDTGTDFVRGLLALRRIAKRRPDLLNWVHEAMGGGYYKTLTETTGAPHKVATAINKGLVGWIEKTADRSPRNAAFLAFAIKDSGHKDIPGLLKYLQGLRDAKPGTEEWYARTRVLDHARQAAGEYERVGRDASLGNFLFLYRWLKASTVWTSRFVTKHPLQAAGVGYLTSQYGYQAGNPIWNRFNVAGHNVQTALPWATPPEVGERIGRAFVGGFPPLGASPLGMLHPAIPALFAGVGHVDIERGQKVRGNAWVSAGKGFLRQTPPGALIAGKGSSKDRLLKYFLGNYAPSTAPPVSSGGTFPAGTFSGGTGGPKITPAQHRQLLRLLKQQPAMERRLKKQLARMQARQNR